MEGEYIANTLMKRLSEVQKEKILLAQQIDREEKFLTDNLQRKLESVCREKESLKVFAVQ